MSVSKSLKTGGQWHGVFSDHQKKKVTVDGFSGEKKQGKKDVRFTETALLNSKENLLVSMLLLTKINSPLTTVNTTAVLSFLMPT